MPTGSHSEALLLRLEHGGESSGEFVKMQLLFQESGVGLRLCSQAACGPQCEQPDCWVQTKHLLKRASGPRVYLKIRHSYVRRRMALKIRVGSSITVFKANPSSATPLLCDFGQVA